MVPFVILIILVIVGTFALLAFFQALRLLAVGLMVLCFLVLIG